MRLKTIQLRQKMVDKQSHKAARRQRTRLLIQVGAIAKKAGILETLEIGDMADLHPADGDRAETAARLLAAFESLNEKLRQ